MNERIQELIEQSGVGDVTPPGFHNYLNNFAELIVLECAKIVDIWSDAEPCAEGYDIFVVSKLKEYFGVKE